MGSYHVYRKSLVRQPRLPACRSASMPELNERNSHSYPSISLFLSLSLYVCRVPQCFPDELSVLRLSSLAPPFPVSNVRDWHTTIECCCIKKIIKKLCNDNAILCLSRSLFFSLFLSVNSLSN